MSVRFVRNPAFEREVQAQASYRAGIRERAEKVAENTRRIAPHGPTGRYAESIVVKGSIVATTDFAGHMVEWGSMNNPPYAPIRRGVKASGLRLRETR